MIRTKRTNQIHYISNINITPLTDVCLVLLIIFMVTMPVISKEDAFKISLPTASQQDPLPSSPIVVRLTRDREVFVNNNRVEFSALGARIAQVHQKYGSTLLVVRADEGLPYSMVINAIDVARGAGVNTIALATRERNGITAPR